MNDLSRRFIKRWDRVNLSQRFLKCRDRPFHSLMESVLSQRFLKRWDRFYLFRRFKKRWDRSPMAKERGKQLERGELYEVAYSHRDGTAVNATAQANIAKMKELMTGGSQLQGNDNEAGILWQPDDAFG
ncbi:hypothetical protein SO802_006397 [Lithocarpus litseifolius]|uniref:Uncharacterized protein n=1 Tax=Lithocarpus litseifolius TaxID=425828 RepID=A0AAW2DP63_9ROSI